MIDILSWLVKIYINAGVICVVLDSIFILYLYFSLPNDEFIDVVLDNEDETETDNTNQFHDSIILAILVELIMVFLIWPKFVWDMLDQYSNNGGF